MKTIQTEEKTDNSNIYQRPKDYLSWSLFNLCCCFCGFTGLFCTFSALFFSFKIRKYVEIDTFDLEKLERYSKYSRRLNFVPSLIYLMFFITVIILLVIILINLKLFEF